MSTSTLYPDGGSFKIDGVHSDTWHCLASNWQIGLLPSLRPNLTDIPGRVGKANTGIEYSSRNGTLDIAFEDALGWSAIQPRTAALAAAIDPRAGTHSLELLDWNPGKLLYFVPSGTPNVQPNGAFAATVSLGIEMPDPFWYAVTPQHIVIPASGWNALPILPNAGTAEAVPKFTITASGAGTITSITLTIAGVSTTYTGGITATDTVVIDCNSMAVTKNGTSDIPNWSNDFPTIPAGGAQLTGANVGGPTPVVTVDYTERWT